MFKKVTILTLITVTVMLGYQLAFGIVWWCDGAKTYCEQDCYGSFICLQCMESQVVCPGMDLCEWICLFGQCPSYEGQCCDRYGVC